MPDFNHINVEENLSPQAQFNEESTMDKNPQTVEGKTTTNNLSPNGKPSTEPPSIHSGDSRLPCNQLSALQLEATQSFVNREAGTSPLLKTLPGLVNTWMRHLGLQKHTPDRLGCQNGENYPLVPYKSLRIIDHFKGKATFTVPVCYTTADAHELAFFMVFDIDDLEQAHSVSLLIVAKLKGLGIPAYREFSGKKGIHVFIFPDQEIPKSHAVRFLNYIKSLIPFHGDLIPGDNSFIKVGPCMHRGSGFAAYFLDGDEAPEQFGVEELQRRLPQQLALLKSIKRADANQILALVNTLPEEASKSNWEDTRVDFSVLPAGDHPPCVIRLIANGGSPALNTYDKNVLVLRSYTNARGMTSDEGRLFITPLIEHTNSPVQTTKGIAEKWRHWSSIEGASSLQNGFHCAGILKARSDLGFRCVDCPVRPKGLITRKNPEYALKSPSLVPLGGKPKQAKPSQGGHDFIPGTFGYQYCAKTSDSNDNDPCASFRLQFNQCAGLLAHCIHTGIIPDRLGLSVFAYGEDRCLFDALQHRALTPAAIIAHIENLSNEEIVRILHLDSRTEPEHAAPVMRQNTLKACDMRLCYLTDKLKYHESIDDTIGEARQKTLAYDTMRAMGHWTCDLSAFVPPVEVLTRSSIKLRELLSSADQDVSPIVNNIAEYIEYLRHSSEKIPTPYSLLNSVLDGGFAAQSLLVLAGLPSSGKTTFLCQCADFAAYSNHLVLVVSLEMSRNALITRGISRNTSVLCRQIESKGEELANNEEKISEAIEHYVSAVGSNLTIVEGTEQTSPAQILSSINQLRAQRGVPHERPVLVVVDYLQLMASGDKAVDSSGDEVARISKIARTLKTTAVEGNIAMLVISEITKDEMGKASKESGMTLNALRGSSRIAFGADCVLFLYSEQSASNGGKATNDPWTMLVNGENKPDLAKKLESARKRFPLGKPDCMAPCVLEIAKNRGGERGSRIPLAYHKAFHRFTQAI